MYFQVKIFNVFVVHLNTLLFPDIYNILCIRSNDIRVFIQTIFFDFFFGEGGWGVGEQ